MALSHDDVVSTYLFLPWRVVSGAVVLRVLLPSWIVAVAWFGDVFGRGGVLSRSGPDVVSDGWCVFCGAVDFARTGCRGGLTLGETHGVVAWMAVL